MRAQPEIIGTVGIATVVRLPDGRVVCYDPIAGQEYLVREGREDEFLARVGLNR